MADSHSTPYAESDHNNFTILPQNFLTIFQIIQKTLHLQKSIPIPFYPSNNINNPPSSNQNKIDNDYKYIYSFEWYPITKEANAVKSLKSNNDKLTLFLSPILSNFFSPEISTQQSNSAQQLPKASQQQYQSKTPQHRQIQLSNISSYNILTPILAPIFSSFSASVKQHQQIREWQS